MKTLIATTLLTAFAFLAQPQGAMANPLGGAFGGVHRAPARGAGVHTAIYNANERADFTVHGDGDTTLNVIVKDAAGNIVTRTSGPGDRCHVQWYPRQTQVYTIYVVNEGNVYNEYRYRGF